MNNNLQKTKSYLGFARRSRASIFGLDNVESKKAELILVSDDSSPKTINKCKLESTKKSCELVIVKSELMNQLFESEKIKVVGITNPDLAEAIKNSLRQMEESN